jgi:hypothetical protein
MYINESSLLPGRRNRVVSVLHEKRRGGTIANIITAVIFFGLIAAGVLWVIKTAGQMGGEYANDMVTTQNKATTLKCQTNLRAIWQNLQIYALSNDKFPESFDELVDFSGSSKLFQCPEPNSPKYAYIPGQSMDSPGDNIVLYEPEPVHNGSGNALRVNGTIELLTPEELQAALEQTKAHLR